MLSWYHSTKQGVIVMEWLPHQVVELAQAAHHSPKSHVRVKALAVLAVARGRTQRQVAVLFDTSPQSLCHWVRAFRSAGLAGFEIAPGRGRKRQVNQSELVHYALQSPRNFGLPRSRWTLQLLAQTVPSLQGMSGPGVWQALRRCGLSWKRGQPWVLSPDPQFQKKDK